MTFVASHMTPRFGLEKAVESLLGPLSDSVQVRLVLLAEPDARYHHPDPRVTTVHAGGRAVGLGRIRTVPIARRVMRAEDGVIVACGVWAAVPILLAAGRSARRVIVWEHSLSRSNGQNNRRLDRLGSLAHRLYRRAAAVVCVSDALAGDLRPATGRPEIFTIPNIVDEPPTRPDPLPDTQSLLTVGSLRRIKNHRLLLEALVLLPDARLAIAGDGPLRSELEARAAELGIADRVSFLGYVDDLREAYRAARVVVHPSLGETFGYVLFEAAQHARPVVALDTPIARECMPHWVPGVTTSDPTPRGLADAVTRALETPPTAEQVEAARRRRVDELSAPAVCARWTRLLHEVAPG